LGLAVLYLGGAPGAALDSGAAVYEVNASGEITQEDIAALMDFVEKNRGRDLILKPAYPLEVSPGQMRREQDEARAAREAAELDALIQEGLESGLYTTGSAQPECARIAKAGNGEPAVFLRCGNGLRPLQGAVSTSPVKSLGEAEARLTEYLRAVLAGAGSLEKSEGYYSSFSDAEALQDLTLSHDGAVVVDFNYGIVEQISHLHPGSATHYMLEQLYRTLFQFRDVTSVTLTLDGSCEAFGDVIEGPCQDLDRELWEQMTELNDEQVVFFTLRGGK
jgi:hypothetical protein